MGRIAKYIIEKDGKSWVAINEKFKNLQTSIAGFGACPNTALSQLLKAESLQKTEKTEN